MMHGLANIKFKNIRNTVARIQCNIKWYTDTGKPQYSENSPSHYHCVHHKPHTSWPGTERANTSRQPAVLSRERGTPNLDICQGRLKEMGDFTCPDKKQATSRVLTRTTLQTDKFNLSLT